MYTIKIFNLNEFNLICIFSCIGSFLFLFLYRVEIKPWYSWKLLVLDILTWKKFCRCCCCCSFFSSDILHNELDIISAKWILKWVRIIMNMIQKAISDLSTRLNISDYNIRIHVCLPVNITLRENKYYPNENVVFYCHIT